jgi:hypothetical protein
VPDVALPQPGDIVMIIDEDGLEYRSSVESAAQDGRIALLRPDGLALGAPLLIGDAMTMTWTAGESKVGMARTRLAGMRRVEDRPVWDAELIGEPWEIERRAHIRVPVDGAVTVSQIVEDDSPTAGRSATGTLVDISPAAVRCAVAAREIWASRRHSQVIVVFELDANSYQLAGHVLSGEIARRDASLRDVIVTFDESAADLKRLQSYLRPA